MVVYVIRVIFLAALQAMGQGCQKVHIVVLQ